MTTSTGSKSERLTCAAIKFARSVPGLKESVLTGVALLTRHETGYLQAKLEKLETANRELNNRISELTSMQATISAHLVAEQTLNEEVKNVVGAFRRLVVLERRAQLLKKSLPAYANHLPEAGTLPALLENAFNARVMPVIVFTHIQKTAGNSVIAYLRRCLTRPRVARIHELEMATGEKTKEVVDSKFGQYDVLAGHIPFSRRVDLMTDRPSVNISIMREPIDRVVSLYYYLKANASWLDQGKRIVEEKMSIADFAYSDVYFDNHMVRMLCDSDPAHAPERECTKEMLEQAKVNVVKNFLLIGVTEQIDEFLSVLAEVFCWSLEDVPKENVNEMRAPLSKVSPEAIKALSERNCYDVELYQFVKGVWADTMAACSKTPQ
ncbi:MAG: sulfotransferase family 2 domain-containing protein [Candidatus Melainabacteria bacterium]|nr:sulfotransferase family 2 domain-containing protein [Candidatus Melainabacteria bacterium]